MRCAGRRREPPASAGTGLTARLDPTGRLDPRSGGLDLRPQAQTGSRSEQMGSEAWRRLTTEHITRGRTPSQREVTGRAAGRRARFWTPFYCGGGWSPTQPLRTRGRGPWDRGAGGSQLGPVEPSCTGRPKSGPDACEEDFRVTDSLRLDPPAVRGTWVAAALLGTFPGAMWVDSGGPPAP